jgi:3D (Asp-Asp-Asp) domain-containing protein
MKYLLLTTVMALSCLNLSVGQQRAQPLSKNDAILSANARNGSGITVTGNISAEELIKKVFIGGDCFDVSNVKYTGDPVSVGKFNGGKNALKINNGIVMTTGTIKSAEGPNDNANYGYTVNDVTEDKDLKKLLGSGEALHDQCILEFDFVPTTNEIQFEFVFASEEYCEYVNSAYNDIFGFFISGPGFNGPYTNKGQNIALVPGSTKNVSINNVNNLSFNNYYVNNVNTLSNSSGSCSSIKQIGAYLTDTQFDGFTTPLLAKATVIPCQKYHIKLAICDVKDHGYDSAVFLKGNSFSSGASAIVSPYAPKTFSFDQETVYEGCDSTAFTFSRLDNDTSAPLTINFSVDASSTATQGVDYQTLPTSVTIPAGQMTASVPVNVLSDAITEIDENIVIAVDKSCSCSKSKISIKIKDKPLFTLAVPDTSFCGSAIVKLNSKVTGNIGKINYLWSTGEKTSNIIVNPSKTTAYTLTISDACAQKTSDEALISLSPNPTANLQSVNASVCRIGQEVYVPVTFTGLSPYQLTYKINGKTKTETNIKVDSVKIKADTVGLIQLLAVNGAGCDGKVSGQAKIVLNPITLSSIVTMVKCNAGKDGNISLSVAGGGTTPYTYAWNNGFTNKNPTNLSKGKYTVTVTDKDNCEAKMTVEVAEPQPLSSKIIKTKPATCAKPYGGYIEAEGLGGTPPYSFSWLNVGGKPFKKDSLQYGDYQALVKDFNGCETTITASVKADTLAPKILEYEAVSPNCRTPFGTLYLKNAFGGVPPYSYAFDTFPNFTQQKIYEKLLPNQYFVSVKGYNGCTLKTGLKIPEYRAPEVKVTPSDTLIFPGDSLQLFATPNLGSKEIKSVTWTPPNWLDCTNCLDPIAKPLNGVVYVVSVKDKFDCVATADARIRINRDVKVYIPNTIRPDGYEGNRKLTVFANPRQVKSVNILAVYDRWGDKVYEHQNIHINDEREGWDGTMNNAGTPMETGVYIYFAEVQLVNGETMKLSGDVVLVK